MLPQEQLEGATRLVPVPTRRPLHDQSPQREAGAGQVSRRHHIIHTESDR